VQADGVHVFLEVGPGKLIEGAAKPIVIVVERPVFVPLVSRAEEGGHKRSSSSSGQGQAGISAALVSVDLFCV